MIGSPPAVVHRGLIFALAAQRSIIPDCGNIDSSSLTSASLRPRDRRTAEQRDEQQPPGWSGETLCPFASDICCRRGSALWQDNHRQRRCWNWLSELGASAYHFDVLFCERHPLFAAEQLEQDLDSLARSHVGEDCQVIGEGTAQDPDAGATPKRWWWG